jgi:hypothetical protein
MWVGALLRRCRSDGVMATVLAKGDAQAGSISLACRRRNGRSLWLTAIIDSSGNRAWLGGRDDLSDGDISRWNGCAIQILMPGRWSWKVMTPALCWQSPSCLIKAAGKPNLTILRQQ